MSLDATRSPLVSGAPASAPARVAPRYRGRALAFVPPDPPRALRRRDPRPGACARRSVRRGSPRPSERRGARSRRQREAERLAAALGDLKGAYAKLGQFAALRYDVLPPGSARGAFATLRDAVPPLPFPRVRAVRRGGARRAARAGLRRRFEPEPARRRVDRAGAPRAPARRARGGGEGAVPVAAGLAARGPRAARAALLGALPCAGPARPRGAPPAASTSSRAGLAEELDFEHEARVAAEIARNLADDPGDRGARDRAPRTARARVLTMSYHAGGADPATAPGCSGSASTPAEVLEILARAYARQIFVDGLFHADPHPGNLFVLDEPGAARAARAVRRLRPLAPPRSRAAPRAAPRDLRAAAARPRRRSSPAWSAWA